jgi:hypothetical protein
MTSSQVFRQHETHSFKPNIQDTQDRELSFVIPTHRLRDAGTTIEVRECPLDRRN